jgi:hypothetical protein
MKKDGHSALSLQLQRIFERRQTTQNDGMKELGSTNYPLAVSIRAESLRRLRITPRFLVAS